VTSEDHTPAGPAPTAPPGDPVRTPFAHASEAEMARILDFYAVRWEYEPHVFPILWNLQGDVVESFSPDFYLPDLDVYLEMTTLKQRLVRKKNRKLRRLRELYPDIRIKLFYARDFRALMLKYGKLALVESLSGSVGQVVPDRSAADAIESPADQVGDQVASADAVAEPVEAAVPAPAKRRRRVSSANPLARTAEARPTT
jgi:hypoxanthine phosphoribosyltransferase